LSHADRQIVNTKIARFFQIAKTGKLTSKWLLFCAWRRGQSPSKRKNSFSAGRIFGGKPFGERPVSAGDRSGLVSIYLRRWNILKKPRQSKTFFCDS
jgi:hypothetical protein